MAGNRIQALQDASSPRYRMQCEIIIALYSVGGQVVIPSVYRQLANRHTFSLSIISYTFSIPTGIRTLSSPKTSSLTSAFNAIN